MHMHIPRPDTYTLDHEVTATDLREILADRFGADTVTARGRHANILASGRDNRPYPLHAHATDRARLDGTHTVTLHYSDPTGKNPEYPTDWIVTITPTDNAHAAELFYWAWTCRNYRTARDKIWDAANGATATITTADETGTTTATRTRVPGKRAVWVTEGGESLRAKDVLARLIDGPHPPAN